MLKAVSKYHADIAALVKCFLILLKDLYLMKTFL